MQQIHHYIGGTWQAPTQGIYLPVYAPATGTQYADLANGSEEDVATAIAAATKAFAPWAATPPEVRAALLRRIATLIEARSEALAQAESQDTGKPLSLARQMDIPRAAKNFAFYASALEQHASQAYQSNASLLNYTLYQPLGVVACISPWNLPLYLLSWKIAPALAAGNAVIAKPSELSPLTAHLLSEICQEAGLPAGVLNILHGEGTQVGAALVGHPAIKAVSFTGGTATGGKIAQITAPSFKKLSLEMGGKNACILFADADYAEALPQIVRAAFSNQGQICLCTSRIFVERSLYERFKEDFTAAVKQMSVGDPLLPDTQVGALISAAHQQKVLDYIALAKAEGGKILCGGEKIQAKGRCAQGYFVAPTVIEGLPFDCRSNQEEIFGPVVSISPFDSEEEVLHYANSVRYGLAASLWTGQLSRAHRMAAALEAGIVWINCWLQRDLRTPFGGMKDSGLGREGGFEALEFFMEKKNVCLKI
jgi:aminomuconate-semialdehyde/2-hydroxymuconate-6-semialdehyde dehydrogenase